MDEYTVQITNTQDICERYQKTGGILRELRRLAEDLNQALEIPAERPAVSCPLDCYNIAAPILGQLDHEELWTMTLNTRNRVTGFIKLYSGSVNASQIRVAEVFRPAIISNDPAIIVFHNHPSGDPTPSSDDVAITRNLAEAAKLLDIQILDHIIVGAGRYVSMKERGLGL